MFDKRSSLFPSKTTSCFLSHCAVSPLYGAAASAITDFQNGMVTGGITSLSSYVDVLPKFKKGFAALLKTGAENISFVHSTAEAMCQLANGYPFEPGDEIISYVHEYPSNHFPWLIQERRGAKLVLLPDVDRAQGFSRAGRPSGWSMVDLERLCTARTRVVAISHVQFSSGYGADLDELGSFCRARDIDLIVDCAQSLGCLPVYPEVSGAAAVASSGWKWLMGPKGGAVLYTSRDLREKLVPTMAGPGMMQQMFNYLDHSWNPFTDGRLFEYSTTSWDHALAFVVICEQIYSRYSMEAVRDEVFRLQDLFLDALDPALYTPQLFDRPHRSGIISIGCSGDALKLSRALAEKNIVVTERDGYLRLAPHFYLDDDQLVEAAAVFNQVAS